MCGELRVLVRILGQKKQLALLEAHRLMEYLEEEAGQGSLVGTVFLGRVERVLPSMGAAFVNIGQSLNGFLPLHELESFSKNSKAAPLATGQEVLVQVKKDAKDDKGAFLSRDIALPGLYCVWMPFNRHVGVSGRVKAEEERKRLIHMGQELSQGEYGLILRHAAQNAAYAEVADEIEGLKLLWTDVQKKAIHARPPAVLHREASELTALLRDHMGRYKLSVYGDREEYRQEIPTENIPFYVQTEIEMEALWQGNRVCQQIKGALERNVELEGGGNLVIDEREALTTLDINTGKFVGRAGEGNLALRQNLAACPEIARQMRLRNLAGILLIDFVDMKTDEERAEVQDTLSALLLTDRVKTVVHGFTKLGLLEMTRKRTRESLSRMFTQPCPCCKETGRKPLEK